MIGFFCIDLRIFVPTLTVWSAFTDLCATTPETMLRSDLSDSTKGFLVVKNVTLSSLSLFTLAWDAYTCCTLNCVVRCASELLHRLVDLKACRWSFTPDRSLNFCHTPSSCEACRWFYSAYQHLLYYEICRQTCPASVNSGYNMAPFNEHRINVRVINW